LSDEVVLEINALENPIFASSILEKHQLMTQDVRDVLEQSNNDF